jgi:hypothetical protein
MYVHLYGHFVNRDFKTGRWRAMLNQFATAGIVIKVDHANAAAFPAPCPAEREKADFGWRGRLRH